MIVESTRSHGSLQMELLKSQSIQKPVGIPLDDSQLLLCSSNIFLMLWQLFCNPVTNSLLKVKWLEIVQNPVKNLAKHKMVYNKVRKRFQ